MSAIDPASAREPLAVGAPALIAHRARRHFLSTRFTFRLGAGIVAVVALAGLLHSHLGLPSPNSQDLTHPLDRPSGGHLFGTDNVGRDVLSRTLAAASLDLRVAVTLTAISVTLGLLTGAISGYFGGALDAILMRLADVALAFPFLVLVIAITAIVGPGLTGVYIGVPLVGWAIYARLTRAEMLSVREHDYIAATRTLGFSRRRTLLLHALPNVWRAAIVYSASDIVLNIVALGTLSYLGLGVQAPTSEWGAIIAGGQPYILTAWWITALPGVVVVVVGLGFSLIGDALGELLGTPATGTAT